MVGLYLRRVVVFAINTGLDRGDILNLKWDDIKKVTLTETGEKVSMVCLRRGKTQNLVEILLNGEAEGVLREIRREQGFKKHEFIFTRGSQRIKRIDGAYVAALGRAELRSPDIEKNVDFKTLRHTFASHLIIEGRSLKEVQELLGHKDIKMTLRYAHLAPQKKIEAVNALNGLCQIYERFPEKNAEEPNISRG